MGYIIRADGTISLRPRIFLRARRTALRVLRDGISLRQARRLLSYKGFFVQKKRELLDLTHFKILHKLDLYKLFAKSAEIISKYERTIKNDPNTVYGKA